MRNLILASLLLGLAGPVPAAQLQLARAQPGVDLAGHDQRMAALSPSLRDWVRARARAAVDTGVAPDPAQLASDAELRLAGQDFAGADIEALVQIVMMEAARQSDADLREIMAQTQASNKRKAEMREAMRAKNAAAQAGNGPESKAICVDPPCKPQLVQSQPQIRMAQPQIMMTQPQISEVQPRIQAAKVPDTSQAKDDMDSMSEMGEMESLRLQMAMDRRSKFMEALSNLMKKNSDTASTITSNLK